MKRKIGMWMAAGLCALTLGGCSDNAADDKGAGADRLADIRAHGKIVIAMEGTWAPWTYHDEKGVLTGYDVEVGRKIAEKIGVKAEFVEGKWDGLLAGLDAGRYDLMINGVDVTRRLSSRHFPTVPPGGSATVSLFASGNGAVEVEVRDTYI